MASDTLATRHSSLAFDGRELFLLTGYYELSSTVLFMK
jgi:hypothetical protein